MKNELKINPEIKIFSWLIILVTLAVSPGLTFDPINVPKFLILGLGTATLATYIVLNFARVCSQREYVLKISLIFFNVSLILSLIGSQANLSVKMFGAPGRQTGTITYICLSILLYCSAIVSSHYLINRSNNLLKYLGLGLSIYGILQFAGFEILPYGASYGSSVFGTFGNSNFLSAFLGISGAVFALSLLDIKLHKHQRALALFSLTLSILVIYFSNSQQGFIVLAASIAFGIFLKFLQLKNYVFSMIALAFSSISAFFIVAAFANRGPLANIVYQSSLGLRKEYWFAALQMVKSHFLFGVGLDNFGSFYRANRSAAMAAKNSEIVTDSAHNVILDLWAGGGTFVLLAYLLINLLTIHSIYRVLWVKKSKDYNFVILTSAWFGYQIQSLISINNLGLAIWGWVFSGLIIGYEASFNKRETEKHNSNKKIKERESNSKLVVRSSFIITPILLALSTVPTFISSTIFYSSLKSGNVNQIKNAATLFPDDLSRYLYVSKALQSNKFDREALDIVRKGVLKFPDSFDLWRIYSTLSTASTNEIELALKEQKRLDPNNPNLK